MGRDLINRYSPDNIARKDIFGFLTDLYRSGKSREVVSFAIWELLHRARLFPASSYIKFNSCKPLVLKDEDLADPGFDGELRQFFNRKKLDAIRSPHKWKRVFINTHKDIFGYLDQDGTSLYRAVDHGESIACIGTFPKKIKSIFVSSRNVIFVSIKGAVYRSSDSGEGFEQVIELASSESYFRHSYAMTETPDGILIIGEYGNVWENSHWRRLPYLYFSCDDGKTWKRSDFLIKKGINKHVHIVRYSSLLGKLVLTDGDNKKKLWMGDPPTPPSLENVRWKSATKFHIQTGGYTSVVESGGRILFGTDYQGGTNFIVQTKDGNKFSKKIMPDPYRRSPIHSLIVRKSKNGNEIWANSPISVGRSKSVLMYTRDEGESWEKVIEYDSKRISVSLMVAANEPVEDLYCSIKDLEKNTLAVYRISDN